MENKMNYALNQIEQNSRPALDFVEKLTEDEIHDARKRGTFDNRKEEIIPLIAHKKR